MKRKKELMKMKAFLWVLMLAGTFSGIPQSYAKNLKITLPRRTKPTEVQQLNRQGVEAVQKRRLDQASTYFYKAYLFDSSDPFTLYNLGYISELQGELERAQKFYAMASEQANEAVIDRASLRSLKNKPMKDAVNDLQDADMRINRENIEAMKLLAQGRSIEAESLLKKTSGEDPRNPFTMNNLGLAKEQQGELEEAAKYYSEAAGTNSAQSAAVTSDQVSRGEAISEIAAASAKRVRERIQASQSSQAQAALLNLRGVLAVNRNDPKAASKDFLEAYKLDPQSAFSLNNAGYVAEMYGDAETAQFFYDKAATAADAGARVGLATRSASEGLRLFEVADGSDQKVASELSAETQAKRRNNSPVELKRRDNSPVIEPQPAPQSQQSSIPSHSTQAAR